MKRILFLLLTLSVSGVVNAQKSDTVRFYYVLQNPRFYGIDNAKSWFEISGMNDKNVQAKINSTLRAAYFEKTELDTGGQNATTFDELHTPSGYTDYSFHNGQTYGYGWVRFKDEDSILRLSKADGYYGSGTNLGGFSQEVAQGKLGWIAIYSSRIKDSGNFDDRTVNLAFNLRTGNVIAHEYVVMIDPGKRDSLENVLKAKALLEVNNGVYRNGVIINSEHLSDSVVVSVAHVIRWMNGVKPNYPTVISRYFIAKTTLISDGREVQWKPMSYLTFDEAIPFLNQDEWQKLQLIYQ
jgi:hypothetical protein